MEKKEALKWLSENSKPIRYALAQRMRHLRTVPELRRASQYRNASTLLCDRLFAGRFASADMGAAMGIMNLLEQLRVEREAAAAAAAAAAGPAAAVEEPAVSSEGGDEE